MSKTFQLAKSTPGADRAGAGIRPPVLGTVADRMGSKMVRMALILMPLLFLGGIANAQVYKWVDEKGGVHYGSCPPPECKPEKIEIVPGPSGEQRRQAQESLERLIEEQKERNHVLEQERERRQAQKAREEEEFGRCLEARKQLAVLEELQLPAYRDEQGKFRAKWMYDTYKGKRRYLDHAARVEEIQRARQNVATYCEDPDDAEEQALARSQWIRSEKCAAARAELEAAERPGSRASRENLEDKRAWVKLHCEEQPEE